jgi:hypothetical protein
MGEILNMQPYSGRDPAKGSFRRSLRGSFPSDFRPSFRRQSYPAVLSHLPDERLGGLVFARIAHVLLCLARQNIGKSN